jgi:hypothetical protein
MLMDVANIGESYIDVKLNDDPDYLKVDIRAIQRKVGLRRRCLEQKFGILNQELDYLVENDLANQSQNLDALLTRSILELKHHYFPLLPIFQQIFSNSSVELSSLSNRLIQLISFIAREKIFLEQIFKQVMRSTGLHSMGLKFYKTDYLEFPLIIKGRKYLFVHLSQKIASGTFKVIYETIEYKTGLSLARLTPIACNKIYTTQESWKKELAFLRELKARQKRHQDTEGLVEVYKVFTYLSRKGMIKEVAYLKKYHADLYDKLSTLFPAAKLQIAYYITKGIYILHEMGWVHRDIKPENILLIDSHQYKEADPTLPVGCLIDFGSIHQLGTPLKTTLEGTLGYYSPELLNCIMRNQMDLTIDELKANDAWALGTLLWNMYFLSDPCWAKAQDQSYFFLSYLQIKRWDETVNRHAMKGMLEVIHGLLMVDPSERLTIKDALIKLKQVIVSKDPSLAFP